MTSISKLTFFDKPVIHLPEVDSTNTYLKESKIEGPQMVVTDYQMNGRGQYGKNWNSEKGKNLLLSFQYFPKDLIVENAFQISQCVAMSIVNTLDKFINPEKSWIKWPNDIIIRDKKVSGILTENILSGDIIQKFVIGIGINVLQQTFDNQFPNACSLFKLFPNVDWHKEELLESLIKSLEENLKLIGSNNISGLYQKSLYRLNESISLKQDGITKSFINLGVDSKGYWKLRNRETNNIVLIQSSSEVEYIF